MESMNQNGSVRGPPGRPPPPFYPSAPPPYYPPQPMHPTGPAPPVAAPYGVPPMTGPFYPPPPAYQESHPGNYPVYQGEHSLYPDISQLPQPEAGNVSTGPLQYGLHGYNSVLGFGASLVAPLDGKPRLDTLHGDTHLHRLPTAPFEPPPPYEASCYSRTSSSSYHTNPHASSHATLTHPLIPAHPQVSTDGANGKHNIGFSKSSAPLGFVQNIGSSSGAPGQPATSTIAPARPAPPPPQCQSQPTLAQLGSPGPWSLPAELGQDSSAPNLKEGQVPPGCVLSWRGGKGLKVFFFQQEGHIVSPQMPLTLNVYKKIGGSPCADDPDLMGVIEVPGCWRLKLRGKNTYVLHTTGTVIQTGNVYVFNDDSTCPVRVVVLQLPLDVTKTMETDLLALLNELTDLRNEKEGVVDKITTGVSSVYSDLTKLNTAVKETVPGAHKSTKWLRKGTGSLVKMGGNLVSKGMHLIAEHVPAGDQPQAETYEESPVHTQLLAALKLFNLSKEEGSITYV
ncbi:uncharacterized protein [Procambarus clarkii]|uniref:uncharacterized protein isoform X1 n=1 Tax=Procambarus clarkii TaxID=6728 RepID=UPI003743EEED